MKRWAKWTLGTVGALAIAGLASKDYVMLHLPGWMAPRVHPNRPVNWQQGPTTAAIPARSSRTRSWRRWRASSPSMRRTC